MGDFNLTPYELAYDFYIRSPDLNPYTLSAEMDYFGVHGGIVFYTPAFFMMGYPVKWDWSYDFTTDYKMALAWWEHFPNGSVDNLGLFVHMAAGDLEHLTHFWPEGFKFFAWQKAHKLRRVEAKRFIKLCKLKSTQVIHSLG